jgi:hypothetical protein
MPMVRLRVRGYDWPVLRGFESIFVSRHPTAENPAGANVSAEF